MRTRSVSAASGRALVALGLETSRAAGLALPVTPHSECDGTFVNFEPRLQRFKKAVTPRGDALWAPELLRRLAVAGGGGFGWPGFTASWRELAKNEPAFAGIDISQLPAAGARLAGASRGQGE